MRITTAPGLPGPGERFKSALMIAGRARFDASQIIGCTTEYYARHGGKHFKGSSGDSRD
jgi:hypothetical protein